MSLSSVFYMKIMRLQIAIPLILLFILLSSTTSVASDEVTIENNSTASNATKEEPMPKWAGFIGCIVASGVFGSYLLPVKQFSVGDGFFFQFVFCVAVWLVGLILDLIIGNQRFYPLVLVGGVLWTTGNLVTVFCIKTCGLSVGLLIWGTTSLIMGWAGGRFGLFGVTAQVPVSTTDKALNYISVVLAAISAIFFLFIKSTTTTTPTKRKASYDANYDGRSTMELSDRRNTDKNDADNLETDFPFLNRINEKLQKVLGCVLAALAGVFYGLMFIPDQYIRDHKDDYVYDTKPAPMNGLFYISSQYAGILLSSLFYFVVYAALKHNKPVVNASVILPALASGALWAIANIGFIVAISALSSAVAYPIVSVLPGIVSSLWSLFLFREIQGKKNYIFLGIGMVIRILAAVFSGLSA
ncbi:unnamed protein product [Adineta steineri]|uniref:Transmembrane protein 144 n=1 Tax=Adineta steineri TaxID=433720 RepID=A0A815RSG6_9BILA|nr:unnamed protein product [Adineta steineri]CAF1638248.1 unnamed protein product [Adineta steineri]